MAILDPGYRPGAGTSLTSACSDTSISSGALSAGTWYQVWANVSINYNVGASVAATVGDPALPSYTLSDPFQARAATDTVSAIRIGGTSGIVYINVFKVDARA